MAAIPVSALRRPKVAQPPTPAQPAAAAPGLNGGANQYAAGAKSYGVGQIGTATSGPVDKTGYVNRDQRRKLRQMAMQNMLSRAGTVADTLGSAF